MKTKRYLIEKGEESFIGYLFPDNVLYWERKGYTVVERPF